MSEAVAVIVRLILGKQHTRRWNRKIHSVRRTMLTVIVTIDSCSQVEEQR